MSNIATHSTICSCKVHQARELVAFAVFNCSFDRKAGQSPSAMTKQSAHEAATDKTKE
ncbi:hypothetical protein EYZ11_003811 [Aspergillus tanneri]|uniref:Uncharacterized protein n=1 Tax=Aspergillus tanneri TaxID=1220188 RepID=A0A4S3JMI5_9EURO|nr:hypothetical protein EYZ11_003811 [Aspergillus tanneri]